MQLFGIYTAEFVNGETTNYVAICLTQRDIVHSSDILNTEDYGEHIKDSVQIEHNGAYYAFECEDGAFTAKGKQAFEQVLDDVILKDFSGHDALD